MARKQQETQGGSWGEMILIVLMIACIYFMLSLFDSSLTGENGREIGKYLRNKWGGAVIVLLLFVLYVCTAKFLKFRIPKLPRQILGTIQLYISFAFMLGFLKETGWSSELTLFRPGDFGSGIAKFFVLNIGTFITLILVACSFLLSAFFFGSRILKLSMPDMSSLRLRVRRRRPRKPSRQNRRSTDDYDEDRPEDILFTRNIPQPKLTQNDEDDSAQISDIMQNFSIQFPKLKPAPEDPQPKPKIDPDYGTKSGRQALEKIDDALAILDSGGNAPRKPEPKSSSRTRKLRRPLPELTFPGPDSESDAPDTRKAQPELRTESSRSSDESVFPPPPEIFGERSRFDASRAAPRDSGKQGRAIITTLKNFNVNASVAQVVAGPSVIQYKLELSPGVKISKVAGLDEELSLDLAVMSVRIEAPILGTHYVGIEIPNPERKTVSLRSIIESGEFINTDARLPLPLGVKTGGKILVRGLEEMQHMLIAGNEGSGRRTFINSCIMSLCSIRRPEELKLILIDPRHVEFPAYEGLPHLMAEPVNDLKTALKALEWACSEMERRTAEFADEKARNIEAYNRKVSKGKRIPEIVIVISELSDLMYAPGNEFGDLLVKLARKSAGAGIYMLIAAQKPSPDVWSSQMKALVTARAVFALSAQADSRNAIDSQDAAKLTGKGDMLFMSTSNPVAVRLQAPYISEEKIADFTEYMTNNLEPPEYTKF
ncbi:MAG: hypothetical protein IJS28_04370 [Synergistaceae bacterium]|nr:hypothetical protein [Synergistaceae bacterium]